MAAVHLDVPGEDDEFPFDPFDDGDEDEVEVTDMVEQSSENQDDGEYYRKMDMYLQQVAAALPPAVPPLPAHADLAAQTLRNSKALLQRPPNLLKANFESAHRLSPGELWLKERVAAFDSGNRRKRKEVLEEFLEYVKQSSLSGMEELFSQEAHLFLVRLTSWFSVTLPLLYELPLQLKVFLVYLEFREASIVRNFFESGTVVALMRALATDFDVPDDVRCLAVLVLHRLVLHGRTHKEVLCSKGLISYLVECILDGLKWETIKSAGTLLCELFRSNPNYQSDVLVALHQLLVPTQPALAQRVSLAALAQLVDEDYAGSDWPNQLLPRLLVLLGGRDLRVSADSYCLLCSLVRRFRCDTMLWDFARQLNQPQDVDAWAEVEVAASKAGTVKPPENLAKRLKLQTDAEIMRVTSSDARDYGASCHEEAVNVLKLSLVMFLVKRSQDLCRELVNKGLTESLLMCLLDVSRPMRQAAVLTELHHLQLLSPHAKHIIETVLVKRELLRALTAEQLMAVGSAEDLAKARRRLRAMQRNRGLGSTNLKVQHSADEHELQQRIIDQQMADTLGIKGPITSNAFLTEPQDTEIEAEKDEAQVPRGGSGCYPVTRVPVGTVSGPVSRGSDEGAFARGYELEHDIRDEPTAEPNVLTALRNILSEPLTRESAEQSSLLAEVEQLCLSARRPPAQPQVAAPRHEHASLKVEHRSAQHRRALIMRLAVRRRPTGEPARGSRIREEDDTPASDISEATSLVCVAEAHDTAAMARSAQSAGWERVSSASVKLSRKAGAGPWPEISVLETSIGPDVSQEFSWEDVSQEMHSISQQEASAHEISMMTTGTAGTSEHYQSRQGGSHMAASHAAASSHAALPEIEEEEGQLRPRVLQTAGLAALVALPREDPLGGKPPSFRKKLLCVAAPPYHNCVAFSSSSQEHSHLERVPTSQLLERIAEAGKFPRRWLRKHSTEEAPSSAREHTPKTPRLPPLQPVSARDRHRLPRWQDKLQGLPAHPLNLTEFFPASKRSVDIGSL